jgi:uncharacterized membrane protein YfcA
MFWLSLILMVMVGITLGLLGSGGSILTLPILIYVTKIDPVTATSYTLFIVGISALMGSIGNAIKGLIDYKTAIYFGIPSLISVYFTRYFILPALPDKLFEIDKIIISKDVMIILLLSILMIISSLSMIRKNKIPKEDKNISNLRIPLILIQGIIIGFITGFVGAGGGFLIVPALIFLCKLPVKKAVGTSLAIIAINTNIGFIGDLLQGIHLDWIRLSAFTISAILGTVLGLFISKVIKENQLKITFGWFVLIMGVFIFVKELFL